MRFGLLLKKFRLKFGYSQSELSHLLGRSNTFISLVESGKKVLPYECVSFLVDIFEFKDTDIIYFVMSWLNTISVINLSMFEERDSMELRIIMAKYFISYMRKL